MANVEQWNLLIKMRFQYGLGKNMLEERITIDSEISHGKPVIKGTRVPLEIVLGSLAGGMEINEVALEYGLEREDVLAAIGYAAKIVASEEICAYA